MLYIPKKAARYWGYFIRDSPVPDYDPSHDAPCPFCGQLMAESEAVSTSVLHPDEPQLCLFYRMHRTCRDKRTDLERQATEGLLLDLVVTDGGN